MLYTPQALPRIFVIIYIIFIYHISLIFAITGSYLLFGIILDKIGPLKTAIIGASMSGSGIILLGFATEYRTLNIRLIA